MNGLRKDLLLEPAVSAKAALVNAQPQFLNENSHGMKSWEINMEQ